MTWKTTFDKGVACFKRGDLEEALAHINQAAELEASNFIIYDSRAAVHEKFGNTKAALLDSKRVIDLAPDRWHGYARSARLFDLLGKHGHAIKMIDHALGRLRPEDAQRRTPLLALRKKAVTAQATAERQVARTAYLLGKLPVETLLEIFTVLIDEDHAWAVKLSHVCGHWRRILISTPSAWQTLVLSKKHPLRKAKLWKERARNRIARLSIGVSEMDRASIFGQLQDISWDDLSSLRTSSDAFIELHHMLSNLSLPHTFSKLDELTLDGCKSRDELSCCLSGPNWELRILRLCGSFSMVAEWAERIQRLKELHLAGVVLHISTLVFTANPLLERLVLNCEIVDLDLDNNASPAFMHNLKTIECQCVAHPFAILRAISAPSITHFTILSADAADRPLLHTASCASLVELHIGSCGLSPSTLPTLLSSTPNLETLRVNSIQAVVNEMFAFLTPKAVDALHELPCRALKHVDVSQCSDLTTSSAYAFVKTRTHYASESVGSVERCAIIISLKLDKCPNIEFDMLPWFRSKVSRFSCVYATRKDFVKNRR